MAVTCVASLSTPQKQYRGGYEKIARATDGGPSLHARAEYFCISKDQRRRRSRLLPKQRAVLRRWATVHKLRCPPLAFP